MVKDTRTVRIASGRSRMPHDAFQKRRAGAPQPMVPVRQRQWPGIARTSATPLVIIASRAEALRSRWRQAIRPAFAVAEATDRLSLERSVVNHRPAAALIDLDLLAIGGIESVPALRRLAPSVHILLLASRPDDREGLVALKMGARGYCDRNIDPDLLAKAVDVVLKGEIWIGRRLVPQLLEELTTLTMPVPKSSVADLDARFARVTPRQRQIVTLLRAGGSNKEIAAQLNVAERTVKAHLSAIFNKLGVSGRLRLAVSVHGQDLPVAGEAPFAGAAAKVASSHVPDSSGRAVRPRLVRGVEAI
jgi:two-component system, NarL family, nitrate/nitrite response regulator NarL